MAVTNGRERALDQMLVREIGILSAHGGGLIFGMAKGAANLAGSSGSCQLDRQEANVAGFRGQPHVFRGHERIDEHLHREECAADPGQRAGTVANQRWHEEEENRIHVEEVPVPRRTSSPTPRERKD